MMVTGMTSYQFRFNQEKVLYGCLGYPRKTRRTD